MRLHAGRIDSRDGAAGGRVSSWRRDVGFHARTRAGFRGAAAFGANARGQSRAVSEGMPMVLWVDEKKTATDWKKKRPEKRRREGREFYADSKTLQIAVMNLGTARDDVQKSAGDPISGGRHGG
jgi:hypothetical protein